MSPGRHVLVSGLVATGCGCLWRSPAAAAAAFVAGTAIDVDHFLDFSLNRMGPFSVRRFIDVCSGFRLRRLYLLAHSLEWIVPFLLWAALPSQPRWIQAAGVGLGLHMLMDLIGNGMLPQAYFLSFRIARRFDPLDCIFQLPAEAVAVWGDLPAWRRGMLADRRSLPRR